MSTNRSLPEMQKLLRSTHHYAIWDDHDYGPNDSDRSWVHKDIAHDLFRMFWANPSYGLATHADGRLPGPGGITSFFSWADADFFLLDNRWFRSPNAMEVGQRTVLGEEQVEWLVEALIASGARWKFVAMGGQFLNTARMWETYANLAPSEREYLLERIAQEGIEGVVFLSGDRHHSELSRIDYKGIRIWDVTTSPLTANPHRPRDDERNELLVEGSLVSERNFAVLEISGPEDERSLVMHFYDSKGTEVYSSELGKQDADR